MKEHLTIRSRFLFWVFIARLSPSNTSTRIHPPILSTAGFQVIYGGCAGLRQRLIVRHRAARQWDHGEANTDYAFHRSSLGWVSIPRLRLVEVLGHKTLG